jgi:Transposase DDE domain
MKNVPQIAHALQEVLGETALRAGRESGFIQREVKLTGASFVQALVFTWLANPSASYEELAQTAATLGVTITPQGLEQRFTRAAADCLKRVLEAALAQVFRSHPSTLPLLERFTEVYVQDSSVILLPESLREVWAGCGGDGPSSAALKLQVRWALRSGALDGFFLTAGRANDRISQTQILPVRAGALRLADLGYWSVPRLAEIGRGCAYWLSRLEAGTHVYWPHGERLDLPTYLARQTSDELDAAVELGATLRLPCRLLAQRVPPGVSAHRRRVLHQKASKQGFTPSRMQLTLCDWTVIVTNLTADQLTLKEALALLRIRWQIELLFKHWKSIGQIASSRSAKPERQLCELYAKLLGQIIQHWCLLCGTWDYPARSFTKAARLVQKKALHLASTLKQFRSLCTLLSELGRAVSVGCKIDKRKGRPSTIQRLQQAAEALG